MIFIGIENQTSSDKHVRKVHMRDETGSGSAMLKLSGNESPTFVLNSDNNFQKSRHSKHTIVICNSITQQNLTSVIQRLPIFPICYCPIKACKFQNP